MSNETPIPDCNDLIKAALAEDIGAGDITSELLIPADLQGEMQFVAREPMVVCGSEIPQLVYRHPRVCGDLGPQNMQPEIPAQGGDDKILVKILMNDGQLAKPGEVIAVATGPAHALLTGERVALNLMQRMSGVATLTRTYVEAVKGTKAVILDTRKTMPGMRQLDKYAVRTGGGQNHRMGLWDMVLVKDNHIALGNITETVRKARAGTSKPVIVECDTLAQVEEAITTKPDRILLDNMSLEMLRKAVVLAAGKIPVETSGGVSLETVRAIAETGVDYISVGKLTHSAPAVDIGADVGMIKNPA